MYRVLMFGLAMLPLLPAAPATAAARIAESGRYICADGSSLMFDRRGYGPVLLRDGTQQRLVQRWVFSGFRFVSDGLELRGRGREGEKTVTLSERGRPALLCNAVPAGRSPGIVTGQIMAMTRLPAGALLDVLVHSARNPARAVASATIRPVNRGWPLAYWLAYPPSVADGRLTARLRDRAGRVIARTGAPVPLPRRADGRHATADLRLVPIAASAPSSR